MKNIKIKKENIILIGSLILFMFFVGYLVFKEANRGGSVVLERDDVIKFFTERINDISPEKPVLGGKWFVTRFRFVGSSNVYVEYEDGHIARAFLLTLSKFTGASPDYRIVGFFEPEPMGYKLLAGEDTVKGQSQEIYEYNQTVGKWIKVN
jgi:hypothetical protein